MTFSHLLLVLRARIWIILCTFTFTVATTVILSLVLPKSYEGATTLVINYSSKDPISGLTLPAELLPDYMGTQVNIIQSHNVALKVVDKLQLATKPEYQKQFREQAESKGDIRDWIADNILLKKLDVEPSRDSSIMEIDFDGREAKFVADVANAFAEAYQLTSVQINTEPSQKADTYLKEQMNALREDAEKAQLRLGNYQQEKQFTSLDAGFDTETTRLNYLTVRLAEAQSESAEANSRHRNAVAHSEESPGVIANLLIQNLKTQLAQAESKLAELSQKDDRNHPELQQAQAEVDKLRNSLAAETKAVSGSIMGSADIFHQRMEELGGEVAAQKAKVIALNHERDVFNILKKEAENSLHEYDQAVDRYTQSHLQGQVNQSEIAILNRAIPPIEPSSPKLLLNTLLSIFFGILLGIGVGLLVEMADRRVRTQDDITDLVGLPVLSELHKQRKRPQKFHPQPA
jgi:chain length determinant protein EpsF